MQRTRYRSIPLLLLVAMLVTDSRAQSRLDLGVRAGMNIANEMALSSSTEQSLTLASILRGSLGVQLDYWFSDHWAASAHLLYDQRGTRRTLELFGYNSQVFTAITVVRLNYFETAFAIKGQLGHGVMKPYFVFGPTVAYLLSSSSSVSTHSGDEITEFYKTDIGLLLGVGTSYAYDARTSFVIDGSYLQGLSGIVRRSSTSYPIISSSFRFLAGVLYRIDS